MEIIIRRHAGKMMMILSAWLTATGQLYWKWGHDQVAYMAVGFVCYGLGAVLMIRAYSLEPLSVVYPLMCVSYIFALLYGQLFLEEELNWTKAGAVTLIGIGVTLTSYDK